MQFAVVAILLAGVRAQEVQLEGEGLVLLQTSAKFNITNNIGQAPVAQCKKFCSKHPEFVPGEGCNWGGCSGCEACAARVEEADKKTITVVPEEEPAGLVAPYGICDTNGDYSQQCVTSLDGADFSCVQYLSGPWKDQYRCAGKGGKNARCRSGQYTGVNHKANWVCNEVNRCDGFLNGEKWGKCVPEAPAGVAPYGICDQNGDYSQQCVTSSDGADFSCVQYVSGPWKDQFRCAGKGGTNAKCRSGQYTGVDHKANWVCNEANQCDGFVNGKKWGKCVSYR